MVDSLVYVLHFLIVKLQGNPTVVELTRFIRPIASTGRNKERTRNENDTEGIVLYKERNRLRTIFVYSSGSSSSATGNENDSEQFVELTLQEQDIIRDQERYSIGHHT